MAASNASLKFSMSAGQIRHFKTAIQCLAKIGSELLIEGIPERLVLRCINTSKSAFMAVTFHGTFFDNYEVYNSTVVGSGVLMKHVMACFRTQKVHKMAFELQLDRNMFLTTLTCDNGVVKKYCLNCIEAEILQATVDRDSLPTHVVAEAKELNRLLSSFQSSLEEITIIANPESATNQQGACQLQSFIDPTKVHSDNVLRTSMQLDTRHVFLSYEHRADAASDVTFNLKDFRAIVGFCDAIGANLSLRFECPGMPLLAEPYFKDGTEDYTMELVLATLMESQIAEAQEAVTPARGLRTPGDIPGDTPLRTPARAARSRPENISTMRKSSGLRSLRTGATSGADRRSRLARAAACPTQHEQDADATGQPPTLLHFNREPVANPTEQQAQGVGADEEHGDIDFEDGGGSGREDDAQEEEEDDGDGGVEDLPAARVVPDDFDEGQDGDESDGELPTTPPDTYAPIIGPVIINAG